MHNVEKREIQNSNNHLLKGVKGYVNKKIILYFSFFVLYRQTLIKYLATSIIFSVLASCGRQETDHQSVSDTYLLPDSGYHNLQSPININHLKVSEGYHELSANYLISHMQLAHLEHTVEVDYDPGSFILFDSSKYDLRQFHFHTPSEHLIDGVTYPLEMHLVHTLGMDSVGSAGYLVVALLFKAGAENRFLTEIIDKVPIKIGETSHRRHDFINIGDLIRNDLNKYYYYKGSLTTFPYTESVRWMVLTNIFEASPEQITRLNVLEGNNARHIQSINKRDIEVVH